MSRSRRNFAAEGVGDLVFDPFDQTEIDDEAFARALQEEYERDFYRNQRQQRGSASSTVLQGTPVRASAPIEQMSPSVSPRTAQERRDAEYARRLEAELRAADAPQTTNRISASCATPITSRSSSLASGPPFCDEDEEVARRIQQELTDEELARSMTQQEEQRASTRRAQRVAVAPPQRSCFRRFLCCFLPMAVIGAVVGFLLYYFIYGDERLPDWFPSPEDFAEEDPFSQQTPGESSRWRNRGQGLSLEIFNALDSEWDSYFYTAVNDWDSGDPDSLTLSTTKLSPDPDCSTIDRAIKVCNGNYGETNWRGINKLLLEGNTIYASAARMNEFYFSSSQRDSAQRQYTMCHEIGHGFGLPHTDESFTNRDLGNCMDYTNRPQNNMQPSSMNFEFLSELYGTLPGDDGSVESQSLAFEDSSAGSENKKKQNGGRNRSLVRSSRRGLVPHRILRSLEEIDNEVQYGLSNLKAETGWKMLHQSEHGEAYEKVLEGNYRVQVHFLLAR